MASPGDTRGELRRSEAGFTLIELLVALAIGMVVLGGAVTVFIGAVRSEPRTASKVSAIQQGRVAVERITRELRQGIAVETAEGNRLGLVTYLPSSSCGEAEAETKEACEVTYACEVATCTRTVAEPDGGSPGVPGQVATDLATTDVFEYSSSDPEGDPDYVGVALSFATREGGPVVVADGATLRNGAS